MKTKGKINATRRRIGKALRYLAATVTTAIGFYVLFSLLFSTEEEKRLQQENYLYATYFQELREKERLVTDVVEGLEMRDDALYRRIFETEAPSVDAVTAADMISVSDSLSESFYLSYSASKSESLQRMAQNVEENFREIYRLMAQRRDSLPPLTLPLEEMSYVQTGASVGLKHNPLYKVDIQHGGIDLIAPQGSPVHASADGVVRNVIRSNKGLGNIVEIDHKNGYVTRYALLGDIVRPPRGHQRPAREERQAGTENRHRGHLFDHFRAASALRSAPGREGAESGEFPVRFRGPG